MSRSVKKGPFAAPELVKRVNEMNVSGDKKVLKTWSRWQQDVAIRRWVYGSESTSEIRSNIAA